MRNPWSWVVWVAAVLVLMTVTRNPLYLLIGVGCVFFVELVLQETGGKSRRLFSPWKLTIWILLLATIFNTLTSHFGQTILFTIPGRIPLISGNVTLEAIVYGATNGLILAGMLMSFSALNMALPVRDLIGLIPRSFFPVAVVTSIAVTYLPTTVRQFAQIREAQAVRGHQMRTLRDWLPLLMPLLVGGLEHAMQLAEAMTARGFGSTAVQPGVRRVTSRVSMLIGILVLMAGWWMLLVSDRPFGWAGIALGGLLILLGLWSLGRYSPRTSFRQSGWSWQDGIGLLGAVVVVAVCLLPLAGIGRESLYYDPYPRLTLPLFSPVPALVILCLLFPGVWLLKRLNQDAL